MLKKTTSVIVILYTCIFSGFALAQEKVRIWQEPLTLPTYKVHSADVNPIFERPLSYQGAHRVLYPYPAQDNFTGIKEDQTYKALYLENEYIKLCVLPEIGGRLFYATDKTNGYEIFYRQHVIKPAHVGMLGAWISGGIEWCVFHHHRASSFMPVDYKLIENPDGSGTIWIGEIEPRQRMRWSIGMTLHPGKSFIEVDVRMFNRTETAHSMLYWANVATHVNDDYQVIFPPSTKYGVYHAKNDFVHWPIGRGKYRGTDYTDIDVSWWKNHPRSISIFAHDLSEGFLAGYDHGKEAGTMYVSNPHIAPGAKLWEWGAGSTWDTKVLTDSDGPYAELMAGAYSDNQPDYSWIGPYEFKQVTQYWYPLRQIGGAKSANRDAAVNLDVKDNTIELAFNTTQKYDNAKVLLTAKGTPIIEKVVSVSPAKPFSQTIPMPENTLESDLEAVLMAGNGNVLIRYKPTVQNVGDELPDVVKKPDKPEEIKTIEQLYLTGLRIKQFHNAQLNPNDYFTEALKRDPGESRCNIQLGLDAAQKGLYPEARAHFQTAVERISKDYTRPRDCEAYYQLGLILKKQGHWDEAYSTLYRAVWDYSFRSAACFQLSEIESLRGNFDEALRLVDESLNTNATNLKAMGLKCALLRKLGQPKAALTLSAKAIQMDPLDYLARNEQIAALKAGGDEETAAAHVQALDAILHDVPESYLELATDYINAGFYNEALDVLKRTRTKPSSLSQYPTIHYYLAWLSGKNNETAAAKQYLASAAQCPTDYCFPFRLETLDVLDYAIETNPNDARAYYLKGNLLYDRQPHKAIEAWEKAVEMEPELAIAHRNLGWANYLETNDLDRAIADYQRAIRYNGQDPRYYYEMDLISEEKGTPPGERAALLEKSHPVLMKHKLALVREILAFVQAGEYDKAIRLLAENQFPAQEGSRRLHEIYVDAHLLRGLERLDRQQYESAMEDFTAAEMYPENLQVARNKTSAGNPKNDYFSGICQLKLDNGEMAQSYFEKALQGDSDDEDDDDEDRRVRDTDFYKGLALKQTGKDERAEKLFERLIARGENQLKKTQDVDFFAKFGRGGPSHVRNAQAYYTKGLGHLGKGQKKQAKDAFAQAIELDVNHIWARYYLKHTDAAD